MPECNERKCNYSRSKTCLQRSEHVSGEDSNVYRVDAVKN